jgi:MFS family permease
VVGWSKGVLERGAPVWRHRRLYSLQVGPVGQQQAEVTAAEEGLAGRVGPAVRRWALYPYLLYPPGPGGGASEQEPLAFQRLAFVQGLSSAGDAMVAVALAGSIFFNVSARAAESKVALSLALTVAPFAVVGPLLGALVAPGKGGRRMIMAGSAIGRAVCCLLMAFWVHSLALFPIAFFTLVFSKLYMVTRAALVPVTVDRPGQLVLANSKLSVGGSAAAVAAGALGAGLLDLFGASGLLRFDIAIYLACAVGASQLVAERCSSSRSRSQRPDLATPDVEESPSGRPPDRSLAGQRALDVPGAGGARPSPARAPALGLPPGGLQLAALATAGLRASTGFVLFLLVFTFRRGSAALIWYGLALGASQVGNVIGALLAPRLRRLGREEWMLTASSVVVGAGALGAGLVHWGREWLVAVALAAGVGLAASSGKLAFDSMVQRDVPSRVRAKSFARFESGFQLAWAFGSLLAVLVPMSLSAGFVAIGIVGLLGAAAFAGGSVKARRGTLPAWWPGSAPPPISQDLPVAPAALALPVPATPITAATPQAMPTSTVVSAKRGTQYGPAISPARPPPPV